MLGHSTVVTTQRYARLDEDAIRREADKVQTVADEMKQLASLGRGSS